MKTIALFCIICLSLNVFADIISPGKKVVEKVIYVNNLNNYPNISLVAYKTFINKGTASLVVKDQPVDTGYKFADLDMYIIPNDAIKNVPLSSIDFPKDSRAQKCTASIDKAEKQVPIEDPLVKETLYYKLQVTNNQCIVFIVKKVSKYKDGTEKTENYPLPLNLPTQSAPKNCDAQK